MSKWTMNEKKTPHDFGIQPRCVRALNDGVIEVIRVALVLILKLMKEVEDVKGEHGGRIFERCRKPTSTEELIVFGGGITTTAVPDDEAMSTR